MRGQGLPINTIHRFLKYKGWKRNNKTFEKSIVFVRKTSGRGDFKAEDHEDSKVQHDE